MMNLRATTILISAAMAFSALPAVQARGQQPDCENLKKENEALTLERDNLLAQAKKLLEYKTRYSELEMRLKREQQGHEGELERINELQASLAEAEQKNLEEKQDLVARAGSLESTVSELQQENGRLKNSLEKAEIEYKIIPETKKELARLQAEKKELTRKGNQLEAKVKSLETQGLDKDAQIEIYRKQVREFKKRYEQAMRKNRQLEKKTAQLPVKFAEMARENKVLIKETALMHYNLGVFYTKNKEYSRSVAEFEKAIELNPDDPYAHYNLGYIYAEFLVDRPKAITQFKKYLSLLKTEDKDSDWVKKYILTWQTWEGKKPIN